MSYLLDRRQKRKKYSVLSVVIVSLIFLFIFRNPILGGMSVTSHFVFKPFIAIGSGVGNFISSIFGGFSSKNALIKEINNLETKIASLEASMADHNVLVEENIKLKETLQRKRPNNSFVLASILAKPNRSLYDVLIVDVGRTSGIKEGDMVFAQGDIPIGRVREIYEDTAKVVLFSASQEKNEVVISGQDVFMEIIGRGGGNFEMILPRDFSIEVGQEVVLPGIVPYVVAKVDTIISDPRDAFTKALLKTIININALKFVEIRI